MNNQEARFVLQAYRHGGQDAGDPTFAAALEQSRRDPELGRWFSEEMEFDAAVSRKLKEVPMPAHLKERILAGRKVVAPKRWTRLNVWLPLAACFVLFAGVVAWQFGWLAADPVVKARGELLAAVQSYSMHVDHHAEGLEDARSWLVERGAVVDFVLPAALQDASKLACRVIDWRGSKVTMLCLYVNGDHVDLLVIDRGIDFDLPPLDRPLFAREGTVNTAMWREGGKVFVLASTGRGEPEAALSRLL